jgi:hypothetical protein
MLACFTGFLSAGGKAGLMQPMESRTLLSKKNNNSRPLFSNWKDAEINSA